MREMRFGPVVNQIGTLRVASAAGRGTPLSAPRQPSPPEPSGVGRRTVLGTAQQGSAESSEFRRQTPTLVAIPGRPAWHGWKQR